MPKFVNEGAIVEESSANTKGNVDNGDETETRRTLYDQLKESKEQKQLEYQMLLEARNSSYKLDEKSAKFYDELKRREKEKDALARSEDSAQLEKYRGLKRSIEKTACDEKQSANLSSMHLKPSIVLKKKKRESEAIDKQSPVLETVKLRRNEDISTKLEGYKKPNDENDKCDQINVHDAHITSSTTKTSKLVDYCSSQESDTN